MSKKHLPPLSLIMVITLILSYLSFNLYKLVLDKNQPSLNQISNFEDKLISIVLNESPFEALQFLDQEVIKNNSIQKECHALTHSIGRAAFAKYNDIPHSLQYKTNQCNQGYLHGVFEGYFSKQKSIPEDIDKLCNSYKPGSFMGWECYHGIGHGIFLFSLNNLDASLKHCEKLPTKLGVDNCANGAFMEYFNYDPSNNHRTKIDEKDLFSVCKEQEDYTVSCYYYAPTFFLAKNPGSYLEALNLCQTAPQNFQYSCTAGVAGQAVKENIADLKLVERLCSQTTEILQPSCISGMITMVMNYYGSYKKGEEACLNLTSKNQLICKNTLNNKFTEFSD